MRGGGKIKVAEVEDRFEGIHEDEMTVAEFWTMMDRESFNSPTLAVHVAVAVLLTLVVVVMAHVNIVTRVVPSHCMWFYWSLAGRMIARVDGKGEVGAKRGRGGRGARSEASNEARVFAHGYDANNK